MRFRLVTALSALLFTIGTIDAQQAMVDRGADRPLPWTLDRQWQVGGASGEVAFGNLKPQHLAVDRQDRLLIADALENRVLVINDGGRQVGAWGRAGSGPGEMAFPLSVAARRDGTVHVFDGAKSALVVFGSDGRVLPEVHTGVRDLRPRRFLDDGTTVGATTGRGAPTLMAMKDSAAVALVQLEPARTQPTPPICGLVNYPVAPVFSPAIAFSVRGNETAATTGDHSIQIFNGRTLVRTVARQLPRRRASPTLARRFLGSGIFIRLQNQAPCLIPATTILDAGGIASEIPAYESLTHDDTGRIWATRFHIPGDSALADVYEPTRGYIGTVALGSARPVLFLSGGRMVSLERDADDVASVVVYRVNARR